MGEGDWANGVGAAVLGVNDGILSTVSLDRLNSGNRNDCMVVLPDQPTVAAKTRPARVRRAGAPIS